MTKHEMENRIKNLELALSALASKTYNRESKVEESVGRVESDVEANRELVSSLEDLQFDEEIRITCLELGIESSELEDM